MVVFISWVYVIDDMGGVDMGGVDMGDVNGGLLFGILFIIY